MPRTLDTTFFWAAAGGVLLWAALPPLDLWPLGWLAPVPWILLIRRTDLPGRRPYRALWLAGFLFWMAALCWLRLPHWATSFGWLALGLYQAFYLPVFVGLCRVAVHRLRISAIVASPVVWMGLELARAHLLTGITMANLGHTQYRWIELIQISDLAGAYGVSFMVMFAAACLGRMIPVGGKKGTGPICRNGPRPTFGRCPASHKLDLSPFSRWVLWPALPLAGMFAAVLGYGYCRTSVLPSEPIARIALIQESIDISFKLDPKKHDEIFRRYWELSEKAVKEYDTPRRPDLVVWPETMFRDPLIDFEPNAQVPEDYPDSAEEFQKWLAWRSAWTRGEMAQMARQLRTSLLLGVDRGHYGPGGIERFNSAAMVSASGGLVGCYDKMHLVLFGEYVPFARYWPWLQRFTPLPVSNTPGTGPKAFDVESPSGTLRVSPSICYENVLPHVIGRQIRLLAEAGQEPDCLVNLTNDGWFWGSSELDMHLACAVFRAVEFHKPFLIAANTGLSAWIDGDGRIRARGPRREKGIVLAEVGPDPRRSWYLRHGDWPAGCCLAACLVLAAVGWRERRRTGRERRNSLALNE